MELSTIAKQIHRNAKEKGFWDSPRNTGELLMLVVSELSEALEADRKGRWATGYDVQMEMDFLLPEDIRDEQATKEFVGAFEGNIKDRFEDEIADAIIRLLDLCEGFGINIEAHIALKMEYNKTRNKMHGKKY